MYHDLPFFAKPGIKEKSFVLYVFLPYTALFSHSDSENLFPFYALTLYIAVTGAYLWLQQVQRQVLSEWQFRRLFCLHPSSTPSPQIFSWPCGGTEAASFFVSESSYLKSSLALTLLTGVLKFSFLCRGLSTVSHIQRLKIV